MKKKIKLRSSRLYSEVQLTGIRHSNTIHRLATIERLLQQHIRIEWASYNPRGRNRLIELDDHDALFLTRTGKAYGQSAYSHHSIRLIALAQSKFKKEEAVELTSHDLRHLHGRRTVTKIRKDVHSDASIESAQLERFRHIMEWRSPETIKTTITTMNERQAMKAVLDDERHEIRMQPLRRWRTQGGEKQLLQENRRQKPHPHLVRMSSIDVRIEKS